MPKHKGRPTRHQPPGLSILYEDEDLIIVDKAPGLLSVGAGNERVKTAFYRLTEYIRKGVAKSRKRLYVVHRLDRETSGILVFAKNPQAKAYLLEHWAQVEKHYVAVVYGVPANREDTISSYLAENRAQVVYSTDDPVKGKLSRTSYRVTREGRLFSMLDVTLHTGRKNQIRVHLADIGHPIVGDQKYGIPDKRFKRLALHARAITLPHPRSGQRLDIETIVPPAFARIVGTAHV